MDPTGGERDGGQQVHKSAGHPLAAVFEFLGDYGWFLLIGVAVCAFLWKKYVADQLSTYASSTVNHATAAAVKKDDDANSVLARHEAMLAARQRMQEEQDRLSAIAKEEIAKREEEKRQQKIKEWELHQKGGGYRSKIHQPEEQPSTSSSRLNKSQPKKPLRQSDYNPLSGFGGGSSYRPSGRRNFGGGGGG